MNIEIACEAWLHQLDAAGGTVTEHTAPGLDPAQVVVGEAREYADLLAAGAFGPDGRGYADYQPGNSSRYRVLIVEVTDLAVDNSGAPWVVSLPFNFGGVSAALPRGLAHPSWVGEKLHCGYADAVHLGVLLSLFTAAWERRVEDYVQ